MIYLLSVVILLMVQVDAIPEFKKNAENFMTVGFKKGPTGTRVTEVSVTVMHNDIFEGGEDVAIEDLLLELKSGDGCWTKVEERPVRRGRETIMWRVKVIPCKEHIVRIGLKRARCVDYFQYPDTIGPATSEEIATSHFRPKMPQHMKIIPTSNTRVNITWRESECAESYDLWYESDSQMDLRNMTISVGVGSVEVTGLKQCTEYTIKMVALVGEEFSDEAEADFTTCQANSTDIFDTIAADQKDDTSCEFMLNKCEAPRPRDLVNETYIEVNNETLFEVNLVPEAHTEQASTSHSSVLSILLTQMSIIKIVRWLR